MKSCEHVRDAILSDVRTRAAGSLGGAVSFEDPELTAHVESCEACSDIALDGATLGRALGEAAGAAQESPPLAELDRVFAWVDADIRRERGAMAWLRARSQTARVLALAGLIVVEAMLVIGFLPRSDLGIYPALRHAAFVTLLGGMALVAAWQSLRPLHASRAPRWLTGGILVGAVSLPFLMGVMPRVPDRHSLGHDGTGSSMMELAFYCVALGSFFGMLVIALLRGVDRGAHGSAVRATLAALAGGLAGTLMTHLHCPLNSPVHLLVAHAPVGVLLAAAYAVFRR